LIYFFEAFENDHNLVTRNPLFGDLNFEQNVQLLHKHALHPPAAIWRRAT
jgi:hypothetical protein